MPVLKYFAVTGPVLFGILLSISAYLTPEKAPSPGDFLGISAANAETDIRDLARVEKRVSEMNRLKQRRLIR